MYRKIGSHKVYCQYNGLIRSKAITNFCLQRHYELINNFSSIIILRKIFLKYYNRKISQIREGCMSIILKIACTPFTKLHYVR